MTKREFKQIANRLDREKFSLLSQGISFSLTWIDRNGDYHHAGIGSGETISKITLIELADLFQTAKQHGVSVEDFAESVRINLLKYIRLNEESDKNDT